MITTDTIKHPEQGLELQNRKGAKREANPDEPPAETEAVVLRRRIAVALATTPKDPIPHCGDCYRRGWAAALRSLE
ncbi:MAG TPA: hypothetical protein VK504_33475 [Vicinamibacterales bacterium]|nr:hypothetical protein [Vicinamibacterales bacterium]